jgi:hypothetical protein
MDILVFQKNGLLILGHASAPLAPIAPPEKRQTIYFGNKDAPKRDMPPPPLAPIAPPENMKSFL